MRRLQVQKGRIAGQNRGREKSVVLQAAAVVVGVEMKVDVSGCGGPALRVARLMPRETLYGDRGFELCITSTMVLPSYMSEQHARRDQYSISSYFVAMYKTRTEMG